MDRNQKILYFECEAGISGDMTLAALIHLGADADQIRNELEKLGIGPFALIPRPASRSSIGGIELDVIIHEVHWHDHDPEDHAHAHDHDHIYDHAHHHKHPTHDPDPAHARDPHFDHPAHARDHHFDHPVHAHDHDHDHNHNSVQVHAHAHTHATYTGIRDMILGSALTDKVKEMAVNIFTVIGRAEAAVHGKPLEEVAFHEVGAMDSILDIVGTAVAIDLLGNPRIFCGPVHDGQGFIECRHGTIPVPVPAVMEMLKESNIPIIVESAVTTEMVTPTGFGILEGLGATFRKEIGIRVEKTGYGFGKRKTKPFPALRIIMGEAYVD